jgi:hypothetical protein
MLALGQKAVKLRCLLLYFLVLTNMLTLYFCWRYSTYEFWEFSSRKTFQTVRKNNSNHVDVSFLWNVHGTFLTFANTWKQVFFFFGYISISSIKGPRIAHPKWHFSYAVSSLGGSIVQRNPNPRKAPIRKAFPPFITNTTNFLKIYGYGLVEQYWENTSC